MGGKIDSRANWHWKLSLERTDRTFAWLFIFCVALMNSIIVLCLVYGLRTYHQRTINASTRYGCSKPLIGFRVDLFVPLVDVVSCASMKIRKKMRESLEKLKTWSINDWIFYTVSKLINEEVDKSWNTKWPTSAPWKTTNQMFVDRDLKELSANELSCTLSCVDPPLNVT